MYKLLFPVLNLMLLCCDQIYHVNLREAAWFSALPWVMMAVLGYVAGVVSDMLIRNGTNITLTRKIMQVCCFNKNSSITVRKVFICFVHKMTLYTSPLLPKVTCFLICCDLLIIRYKNQTCQVYTSCCSLFSSKLASFWFCHFKCTLRVALTSS